MFYSDALKQNALTHELSGTLTEYFGCTLAQVSSCYYKLLMKL